MQMWIDEILLKCHRYVRMNKDNVCLHIKIFSPNIFI